MYYFLTKVFFIKITNRIYCNWKNLLCVHFMIMNETKKLVFCLVMSMLPYIAVSNYRLGLFVENSSSVVL